MEKKEKNTPRKKTLKAQQLEEDKLIFLTKCLELGNRLVQDIFPEEYQSAFTPATFDELVSKWNKGELKRFNTPEHSFINILGALLGHYINEEFNGEWLFVSDEYTSEYVCKIDNNQFEFRFSPFSTVKNAVQDHQQGKLTGIITAIKEKLKD